MFRYTIVMVFLLMLVSCLILPANAQQTALVATSDVEKNEVTAWAKIDARPTPSWWTDAKFGIFIHWGPYSVPAFSEVGQYSEWYWEDLVNSKRRSHKLVKDFHDRVYGELFAYADFVPMFTCELFEPGEWAETFKQSGAKYVVLTSKHHDGYCLWPSAESDRNWGRAWSSTNSGPGRDLVGELTDAVRKAGVKMGLYYSIYEWRNPLYRTGIHGFVDKHLIPQFKDMVNRYKPSIIFTDGEWDYAASTWKTSELLTWLFNESPCKDEVVINDRWGKGDRHKHGGYYTTEYGAGLPNASHPWEENRGMAHSFGYSRTERAKDYNSTETLVLMLVDIVSRGGNFLLDIGPTADGRIPPLMEERLLEMGDWLEVNGEAIYGTTTHSQTCQWSEGGELYELGKGTYRVEYDVNKLIKNPDPGKARKEYLFTRKGVALYAICAVLPDEIAILRNVVAAEGATVSMLGVKGDLDWKQVGDNIQITMPKLNPSKMPCEIAWTFKISKIKY